MNTSHCLPSQTLFVLALPSRVSWCMFHCSMAKRGSIVLILVLSPFLESIFLVYPTQFLAKYSKNDLQIFFGAFIFLATLRMYMKPVKITKYSMNMQNIKHTWHHDYEQRADCLRGKMPFIMDMLRQHRDSRLLDATWPHCDVMSVTCTAVLPLTNSDNVYSISGY